MELWAWLSIMARIITRGLRPPAPLYRGSDMTESLRSPQRELIELRIDHSDLDNLIDLAGISLPVDELALRRLKKKRLRLRDRIARLEVQLQPQEPA